MRYHFLKWVFLLIATLGWMRAEPVNALIHEESPYLQQHAHNPVHWMPWGRAAFEKASREHKPIFLSIGYSTCHWCHVMEHESFEDPEVAAVLNRYFVPIKVDREEHPQIDRYYQQVHRIMTRRSGGWPLTILLTPDRKPFFAATYIPREERYGQPGLLDLLQKAAKLWQKEPGRLGRIGEEITTLMQQVSQRESAEDGVRIREDLSRRFVKALEQDFDREHGGWGSRPKFPRATTLTALIQIHRLTGNKAALDMAEKTLKAMARGGIYDQIEGAFFRYSTDGKWRIPHFEKMLYTNAELLEAYALAAELTGKALYRRIVEETVSVLERHYRDRNGLFYGASDADSLDPETHKKEEGFYFTFAYDEALKALKKAKIPEPEKALEACGISEDGNRADFRSNPYLKEGAACPASDKRVLAKLRAKRPYPFIDTKLQASWNAMLIHGLFTASDLKSKYAQTALATLEALKRELYLHGRLYHQKLPGRTPKVPGLLEDYSFTIAAALDAYEWSQDPAWLDWAKALYAQAKKEFYERGIWYDAQGSFRNPLSLEGGSYRSPLAVMADNLLRLAVLTEDLKYRQDAREILTRQSRVLARYPQTAPMGVLVWLADRYGYVVLKIPAKRLPALRHEITRYTAYPFLLFRAVEESLYQACRVDRCFLYDRDEKGFLEKLARSLKVKN